MEHLTTEALARLMDGDFDDQESRHLAECRICADELRALREQTDALGALPALRPPQGDWEALEARLLSEGLLNSAPARGALTFTPRRRWTRVAQAAAALVLFVGGAAVGTRFSSAQTGARGPGMALGSPGTGQQVASAVTLTTLEEAADEVRLREQDFIDAMIRYRELAAAAGRGLPETEDPATRYAALGAVMAASQAAVREAPADPFLNGILASVTAERQAYLQNLSQSNRQNWY